MKKPLVSLIVPIYNVENYVDECLSSIADQTYKNIEIIVVDDGSSDGSLRRCDLWAALDDRFKIFTKSNGGLSSARNVGLRHVTGDYVCFVDSDDWVDRKYVERLLTAALSLNVPLVCCGINICYGNDKHPHSAIHGVHNTGPSGKLHRIASDNPISCRFFPSAWNKIFSAKVVEGLSFPEGDYFEDHAFFLDALSKVAYFGYTSELLYFHRRNRRGQITMDGGAKVMDIFKVIERVKRRHIEMMSTNKSRRVSLEIHRYIYRLLWERTVVVEPSISQAYRAKALDVAQNVIDHSDIVKDKFIPWYIKDFFNGHPTVTVVIACPRNIPNERLARTIKALKKQTLKSIQILLITSKTEPDLVQMQLPDNVTTVHTKFPFRPLAAIRFRNLIRGRFLHVKKAGFTPAVYYYDSALKDRKSKAIGAAERL